MSNTAEAKAQLLKAVKCLYIELPELIADDVKKRVNDYIEAVENVGGLSAEQAAEAYANGECGEIGLYTPTDIRHKWESIVKAFLAGASHPITEELIKELEGKNPYTHQDDSLPFEPTNGKEGWNNCISTLLELIKAKQ
jgi:hypothetical protein